MAPRAKWKGYLKLSLVSCPIALYPASSISKRLAFHRISKATGHRLRQQMVDPQPAAEQRTAAIAFSKDRSGQTEPHRAAAGSSHAAADLVAYQPEADLVEDLPARSMEEESTGLGPGAVVPRHEIARGYQLEQDRYIEITDEELKSIRLESTHTIDIDCFVPGAEVDKRYLQTAYYVAPSAPIGEEAFAVIREAIKAAEMVALGRVVMSGRERVIMLEPFERGLLGITLRYPYEVRDAAPIAQIAERKVPGEMLEIAAHIIKIKTGHFDPTKFVDHYEAALTALINQKRLGQELAPASPPGPPAIVNLMDALRKSLQAEKTASPAQPTARRQRLAGRARRGRRAKASQ